MQYKHKTFIKTAKIFAQNSYANRLKVGAVLAYDDRILAVGYNGTPKGYDNDCEEYNVITGELETKDLVVHAEQNLICFCAKNGIKTDGCTLYITHSPCITCAKLIASAGIKKVIYETDYRSNLGIELLKELGVEVEKFLDN